ncbi:MAG: hypothetical protein ACRCZA_13830 [Shewanella sp.]|uniref:hypothetical protein n=1 Tax=Shewanella sp. TaxID=50422 RepID=UPI003F330B68
MKKYYNRIAAISQTAKAVRNVCIDAQFDGGQRITDPRALADSIATAASKEPMFEALGDQQAITQVSTAWAGAMGDYIDQNGQAPRDELLASCAETLLSCSVGHEGESRNPMFESIGTTMRSSEGVEIRAKTGALILPVALAAATNDAATFVQGGRDETEMFEIVRVSGTAFGDMEKGQQMDEFWNGQYTGLKQTYTSPVQGDGAATTFVAYIYNEAAPMAGSATTLVGVINNCNPQKIPYRRKSVRVMLDGKLVASDLVNNGVYGQFKHDGVDYSIMPAAEADNTKGIIAFKCTPALPAAAGSLMLQYDVDVENANAVLPEIQHEMLSYTITPHQSIVAAQHTIMGYWAMKREYGIDMRSLQTQTQRNVLAYEKDMRNLRDMLIATMANPTTTIPLTVPAGSYFKEKYEEVHEHLLVLSQAMQADTKTSGLVGMFCGSRAASMLKALGAPYFTTPDNYRQVPKVHYCGLLFGKWKVYEVPFEIEIAGATLGKNDILCYARGQEYSQAGLLAGDAVPATMYKHGTLPALFSRDTLWELSFGDISPRAGYKYFRKVTISLN